MTIEWETEVGSILPLAKWDSLTIRERIRLCREHAQEAEQYAQAAHPDRSVQYKRLAAEWHQIAAELEQFGSAKISIPNRDR